MMDSGFLITRADDWAMLIAVGGVCFLSINIVIFGLINHLYRTLVKKEDLLTLQVFLTAALSISIKDAVDRFELALEKNNRNILNQHDKDIKDIKDDFKEWRDWHNANCPYTSPHPPYSRTPKNAGD